MQRCGCAAANLSNPREPLGAIVILTLAGVMALKWRRSRQRLQAELDDALQRHTRLERLLMDERTNARNALAILIHDLRHCTASLMGRPDPDQELLRALRALEDASGIALDRLLIREHAMTTMDACVNASAIMRQILEDLAPIAHQRAIHVIETGNAESSPAWVRGDPLRIRRIARSLLSLALETAESAPQEVRITWEHGPPPRCTLRLPAHAGQAPGKSGALVLETAECATIMRAMGGELRLRPLGNQVTVELIWRSWDSPMQPAAPLLTGCAALIVDDAPEDAAAIQMLLRALGGTPVDWRANVRDAKIALQTRRYHVAILDETLPGGASSIDLAAWMARQPALRDCRRIWYGRDPCPPGRAETLFHGRIPKPLTDMPGAISELRSAMRGVRPGAVAPTDMSGSPTDTPRSKR